MKQFHYFYKITNLVNGHYYYGVHSTYNINDNYMGSGPRILEAYEQYGVQNFVKEILQFFDTAEEAYIHESKVVTELQVADPMCYNIQEGGKYRNAVNTVVVYDVELGKNRRVYKDDERYLSGELVPTTKDKVVVKNQYGRKFAVDVNDPRYVSAEYTSLWKGKRHSDETIQKQRQVHAGKLAGAANPAYGTCWVHNDECTKRIKKEELSEYLANGYEKGMVVKDKRKMYKANSGRIWVHNGGETHYIKKAELEAYILNGYKRGRISKEEDFEQEAISEIINSMEDL